MVVLGLMLTSLGCGEDPPPPPPNLPEILDAKLSCARLQGTYFLSEMIAQVRDYDGADSILQPSAELVTVALTLAEERIPAPSIEEEEMVREQRAEAGDKEGAAEPICEVESCEVKYLWRLEDFDDVSPILCGDDGKGLSLKFRVMDDQGTS